MPKAVRFPAVPADSTLVPHAGCPINGTGLAAAAEPLSYVRIERAWSPGDTLSLRLPMTVAVRTWTEEQECGLGGLRSALTFSLKIGEQWSRDGGTGQVAGLGGLPHDALELRPGAGRAGAGEFVHARPPRGAAAPASRSRPTPFPSSSGQGPQDSPVDAGRPGAGGPVAAQPGAVRGADRDGDADSDGRGPAADHRLPDNRRAVRRRMTWNEATDYAASASHCHDGDSVESMNDGITPASSNDQRLSALHLVEPLRNGGMGAVRFRAAEEDLGRRGLLVRRHRRGADAVCRPSWKLLDKDGEAWKPVENASGYGTRLDRFNRTTFRAVQTKGAADRGQVKAGFSGGIHQWKVEE